MEIEHPTLGSIAIGDDVLVRHPEIGSRWLQVTGFPGCGLMEGKYLDIWPPSAYLPADGLDWGRNCFPTSCVFKVEKHAV
jgi:hypothetical protein